jgi:hypothetical protein
MTCPCCYGNDPNDLPVDEQEGGQPGASSAGHGEPPLTILLRKPSLGTKPGSFWSGTPLRFPSGTIDGTIMGKSYTKIHPDMKMPTQHAHLQAYYLVLKFATMKRLQQD